MKVLVTGSEGFIGKPTTWLLESRGHQAVCLDTARGNNINQVAELPDCDTIVHLAAVSSTPWANSNPSSAFETNVYGTYNLLNKSKAKRFVYSSSSRIINPSLVNSYIVSKILQNDVARLFRDKMQIAGLLYTSVYGVGGQDRYLSVNVLNQIIDAAVNGTQVTIYGDGKQTRDFIFYRDVALANTLAAESDAVGLFNIGCGRSITLLDAIKAVERVSGKKVDVKFTGSYSEDYMLKQEPDVSLAYQAFGFSAPTSLEDGISACVEDY